MITLYKFISEQELFEIEAKNFKEFPSHFPLHFYIGKTPETSEQPMQFLVKFETEKKKLSHLTTHDEEKLIIDCIGNLDKINFLINDKIKVIGISGKSQELKQDIRDILEKEKRFFEFRLKIYLNTNNREIIPYDYFEQRVDSDNNICEPTDREKEISAKYYDEKRSKINTVEEAVNFLINEELNEENINEIKNKSLAEKFDQLGGLFGLGMYLRNIYLFTRIKMKTS